MWSFVVVILPPSGMAGASFSERRAFRGLPVVLLQTRRQLVGIEQDKGLLMVGAAEGADDHGFDRQAVIGDVEADGD